MKTDFFHDRNCLQKIKSHSNLLKQKKEIYWIQGHFLECNIRKHTVCIQNEVNQRKSISQTETLSIPLSSYGLSSLHFWYGCYSSFYLYISDFFISNCVKVDLCDFQSQCALKTKFLYYKFKSLGEKNLAHFVLG